MGLDTAKKFLNKNDFLCVIYISTTLQSVTVEMFPPSGEFHRRWRLDPKQLLLKMHNKPGQKSIEAEFIYIFKHYELLKKKKTL